MDALEIILTIFVVVGVILNWFRFRGPKLTRGKRVDPSSSKEPTNFVEAELARRRAEGHEPSTPFDRAPVESLDEPTDAAPKPSDERSNDLSDGEW
ncbi:hypothetical protein FIV42_09740 [Persicimonas caeni]|uniref:Uncharacterized protein n=1 Tax=Persicimonas caeni TaxID=2292766 RepID=A0A4Y6PSM1_PERCE|nr:hypothetical protein [Persicimonas caeni]QDG51007.1 hypothetical protein FIV42_09740 [Persicimonas caeni]QED32228.1 hypothetical protein FRD00_09735 [Persicimonas caeni]